MTTGNERVRVYVTGGTWRQWARVYWASLRLQHRFNRATPERQEALLEALRQAGAREVRDDH